MFWGRWLTEGVTGIHYFQNWGEIAWNPEVLKVFEANRAMYQMVGKYHAPFARVAGAVQFAKRLADRISLGAGTGHAGWLLFRLQRGGALLNYCPRDGIGAKDFGTPTSTDTASSLIPTPCSWTRS